MERRVLIVVVAFLLALLAVVLATEPPSNTSRVGDPQSGFPGSRSP